MESERSLTKDKNGKKKANKRKLDELESANNEGTDTNDGEDISMTDDDTEDDTEDENRQRTKTRPVPARIMMTEEEIRSVYYKMTYPYRGTALIFNIETFRPILNVKMRRGTDKDAEAMKHALGLLGFNTKVHKNLTSEGIRTEIQKAAMDDHNDSDCFCCVILSHGERDYIYGVDSVVHIEDILLPFKGKECPSLCGKPKLFFIQACRGQSKDPGINMQVTSQNETSKEEKMEQDDSKSTEIYKIPVGADFLIVYSTPKGYTAWRNTGSGTHFIQSLATELEENYEKENPLDLLRSLTRVNREIAFGFQTDARKDKIGFKQVPCIESMLTKDIYFRRKE